MLAIRAYLLVDYRVNAGGYARLNSPGSWDATEVAALAVDDVDVGSAGTFDRTAAERDPTALGRPVGAAVEGVELETGGPVGPTAC